MRQRVQRIVSSEGDGFTFVEILVTLTIIAVVFPALLQAFGSAARTQRLADNRTTALYLLKSRMAEIQMTGYPEVSSETGEFGENTGYRWSSVVENIDSEEVENVRRVQVTVMWQHGTRERSMSMSTFIADRQKPQAQQGQQGGGGR